MFSLFKKIINAFCGSYENAIPNTGVIVISMFNLNCGLYAEPYRINTADKLDTYTKWKYLCKQFK